MDEHGGGTLITIQLAGDGQSVDISTPLTVRDLFAGLALVGVLASPTAMGEEAADNGVAAAAWAYTYADAMLKERGGTDG